MKLAKSRQHYGPVRGGSPWSCSVEAHNGAMEGHPGALEAHNGAMEANPGALEDDNGDMEAENGAMEV